MKSYKLIILLIVSGFVSILGQIVILRELNCAFFGIELIYILALGFWLLGAASGAGIGRHSKIPSLRRILFTFLFTGIILYADILFIRGIRNLFGGVPGEFLPFTNQIISLIIALIPFSFLTGLIFQWTAKTFILESGNLAKAYAYESLGGLLGGAASTLFLIPGIQNSLIGIFCGIICFVLVFFYSIKNEYIILKYVSIAVLLASVILIVKSSEMDLITASWNHYGVVESSDTPYNRVTIISDAGQVCLFENDVLSYDSESSSPEEFVQFAGLNAEELHNVLILGGGYQGTVNEMLKLPVKKIDYVEINSKLIDLFNSSLAGAINSSLNNDKVKIIYEDPAAYLNDCSKYDLILSGAIEPASLQANRFFTKEYFIKCSRCLNPKGVISFKLSSSENLWTPQLIKRNRAIYNALASAFKYIVVLPGSDNIFIASQYPLPVEPSILKERFLKYRPATKLVTPQYISYIYTNDRFESVNNILKGDSAIINSESNPVCYPYTISIWLSKFYPGIWQDTNPLLQSNFITKPLFILLVIIIGLCVLLAGRKSSRAKYFILAAVSGFGGMALESIIILNYQSRYGALYRDLGLLLTAFMAGMSVGAYYAGKLMSSPKLIKLKPSVIGSFILIIFVLINMVLYYIIKSHVINGFIFTYSSLFVSSFMCSVIFVYSVSMKARDANANVIRLYAADLIGGSIAAIVTGIIIIPFGGLTAVPIGIIGMLLFCMLMII